MCGLMNEMELIMATQRDEMKKVHDNELRCPLEIQPRRAMPPNDIADYISNECALSCHFDIFMRVTCTLERC